MQHASPSNILTSISVLGLCNLFNIIVLGILKTPTCLKKQLCEGEKPISILTRTELDFPLMHYPIVPSIFRPFSAMQRGKIHLWSIRLWSTCWMHATRRVTLPIHQTHGQLTKHRNLSVKYLWKDTEKSLDVDWDTVLLVPSLEGLQFSFKDNSSEAKEIWNLANALGWLTWWRLWHF